MMPPTTPPPEGDVPRFMLIAFVAFLLGAFACWAGAECGRHDAGDPFGSHD
jgi:hypothetical protein